MFAFSLALGAGCVDPAPEGTDDKSLSDPSVTDDIADTGPITCMLRGETVCDLGTWPRLTVLLGNRTAADIYLVGNLDGSDAWQRYPHTRFEVTGPAGPVHNGVGPGCGFMNTLRVKDFVKVPPGGTFDPFQKLDDLGFFDTAQLDARYFPDPGKYGIRFVYSTRGANIHEWAGNFPEEVVANDRLVALFARVPKVEVRSNEFELTVVAPPK